MSKILNVLGFMVAVVILLFVLLGGTELIASIFNVEESGNKRLIRWGLIAVIAILGSVLRRKYPSVK